MVCTHRRPTHKGGHKGKTPPHAPLLHAPACSPTPIPSSLQRAHAATRRDAALAGPAGARGAASAVAAAARELRPVEIVSVYEAQREAADAELAVLRQEVGDRFLLLAVFAEVCLDVARELCLAR